MALRFQGSQDFRLRLACATLSGRTIRIDDIRSRDENPGLRDYEASLLRLLEKVTNGCVVEINETGVTSCPPCNRPGIVWFKRLEGDQPKLFARSTFELKL